MAKCVIKLTEFTRICHYRQKISLRWEMKVHLRFISIFFLLIAVNSSELIGQNER